MAIGNSIRRIREEDLFVNHEARPDWISATDRTPAVGEHVFCTAGQGVVTALLGKTCHGSRLLQIQLDDPTTKPFFAAASNVLVAPR